MWINHLINPNYSSDFNKLFDRVFDQIVEEELMENTLEELFMSSRLENQRRRQSHTSVRRKRTKRRRRHTWKGNSFLHFCKESKIQCDWLSFDLSIVSLFFCLSLHYFSMNANTDCNDDCIMFLWIVFIMHNTISLLWKVNV
jgi:hypothetical protein